MTPLTRRRFVTIAACAAAGPGPVSARSVQPYTWAGTALGARASIRLDTADREQAREVISLCVAEVDRLESLFSLYRTNSALSVLNRRGGLTGPAPELLELLSLAHAVHLTTEGAFDPSVQPVWAALARLHATTRPNTDTALGALEDAARRVGFGDVRFSAGEVRFLRPGMALTLNGIAQGFVTDRIAALLQREGLNNVLVHMGETRALGSRADGSSWRVGVRAPTGARQPMRTISIRDRALATSATLGTTFSSQGRRIGHIIDPRSGHPVSVNRQVSIIAPSAALADALSTALCLLPGKQAAHVMDRHPGCRIVSHTR